MKTLTVGTRPEAQYGPDAEPAVKMPDGTIVPGIFGWARVDFKDLPYHNVYALFAVVDEDGPRLNQFFTNPGTIAKVELLRDQERENEQLRRRIDALATKLLRMEPGHTDRCRVIHGVQICAHEAEAVTA